MTRDRYHIQTGHKGAYYPLRTVTGCFVFRSTSRARRGSGSPRQGLAGWGVGVGDRCPPGAAEEGTTHPWPRTCVPKGRKGDPSSGGAGSRGSRAAARPFPPTVPEGIARKESLPVLGPLNCPQTRSCQPPPEPGTSLRSAARGWRRCRGPAPSLRLTARPREGSRARGGRAPRGGAGQATPPRPRGNRPPLHSPTLIWLGTE